MSNIGHTYSTSPSRQVEIALALRTKAISQQDEEEKLLLDASLLLLVHVVQNNPENAEYIFYLATAHDILDQEKEAIPLYHQAISLGLTLQQQFDANLYLASSYYNTGDHPQATEYLGVAGQMAISHPHISSAELSAIATRIRQKEGQEALAIQQSI